MAKMKDGDQYLLQDGTYADPKACKAGKDGVLRHENGVGVALKADGEPMTLADSAELNKQAKEAKPVDASTAAAPEPAQAEGKAASAKEAEEPAAAKVPAEKTR